VRRACLWRDPLTGIGCPNYTLGTYCEWHAPVVERRRRANPDLTGRRDQTPEWRRARRRALHRDQHRCRRCGSDGREPPAAPLEVHHINGVAGDDRLENLETLCRSCHRMADRALGVWR